MNVIFDTNIFRDIQRGRISKQAIETAKVRLSTKDVGFVSPVSLIELGSHVNENEKKFFSQFHDAFKAVSLLCSKAVYDPETFLKVAVFNGIPDQKSMTPIDTIQISRLIAGVANYEQLVSGQALSWNGTPSKVTYNPQTIAEFRKEYEKNYVEDMESHVLSHVAPDFKQKRQQGKMANIEDPELRKQTSEFLMSDDFRQLFYRLQATRVGFPEHSALPIDVDRMDGFFVAYRWILRKIVESGYNPKKNKNDFNDIHMLLYLTDDTYALVTGDGGFDRKLNSESRQSSRVFSFDGWLAS